MAPKPSHIVLPKLLNALLTGVLAFEARLMRGMNLPAGTSVVVLARKRSERACTEVRPGGQLEEPGNF